MKVLVILVAVSCCSAQLVLPYGGAPWVLPTTKLITNTEAEAEVKPVALASPYLHPFGLGHHPFATPYNFPFAHHLPYVVAADATLKATEFPYIYQKVEAAAEEPAVEEARRRRRDVTVPLPYIHAVPTTKEITIETKQFEATDDATPADTKLIALTTKEHDITIPAVKYVQPHINLKPVTYSAVSPAFLPYHAGVAPGLVPSVVPYHAGLHPFAYPTFAAAPVIKIDEE